MKKNTLMRKFKNEWVLAKVLKEENYEITEVEPIFHSKNRDEVYDALGTVKKGSHVFVTYTGKLPKGMVYSF